MDSIPTSAAAGAADYRLGFTSLETETDPIALEVRGELPAWLSGALLRTGPCRFEFGGRPVNHWFDGLGMLHRFAFAGGEVRYNSRFLRTKAYAAAERTGRMGYAEFATDPCRSLFKRIMTFFMKEASDNANISVDVLAGTPVALGEATLPIRFDPETLATLGVDDRSAPVSGQLTTAHPHHDTGRGRDYSSFVLFGRKSVYRLVEIDARTGEAKVLADMPAAEPAYMHSFGMSGDHLILAEFPFVVNPLRLLLSGKPFICNYKWRPERGLKFHIVPKAGGGRSAVATGEAAFAFHHVNAFEDGDAVLVDMVTHRDASAIGALYLDRLREGSQPEPETRLTRYRVPLDGGEATSWTLSDESIELPRFNYGRAGRPYAYAYALSNRGPGDFMGRIVKLDLDRRQTLDWQEERCYPSEPVFVAAPGAEREDEGVILSVVLDAARGTSFLLVLDAADMAEVGRAEVPHHIPFGFHGNWFGQARAERAW